MSDIIKIFQQLLTNSFKLNLLHILIFIISQCTYIKKSFSISFEWK